MEALYTRFVGQRVGYDDLVYHMKKLIMRASMSSEINTLGHQLNLLSERDRQYRDFTLNSLTHAIGEIIACFPVYRSYVTPEKKEVLEQDQTYICMAVARAKRRNPAQSSLVFDFVRDLLLRKLDDRTNLTRDKQLRFVTKFQQTTSPVTAKGIEDTAFYIYNRLVSLNEVGGEPVQFGLSVEAFHKRMRERRANWPHGLLATSTHDTKRGEDVRARLNVLSEIPDRWRTAINRWAKFNKRWRTDIDDAPAPDRNEEYLLYQILVGAWPLTPMDEEQYQVFIERIQQYMLKATREAKVHTSWVNPHEAYEEAVKGFVAALLDRTNRNLFLEDLHSFQELITACGMKNGLSQLLVKLTAPGIPDCYQGTELWEFSLVDPDNRRPVDFDLRRGMLDRIIPVVEGALEGRIDLVRALMESWKDGGIKLYVLHVGLRHRRAHPALYLEGDYVPLDCEGRASSHLCAYARLNQDQAVVTVVPRLTATMNGMSGQDLQAGAMWDDSWIVVPSWKAGSNYINLLTGERLETVTRGERQALSVDRIFKDCPVALLERCS